MTDWFSEWFGDEYIALYPHRDEHEAGHAVEMIEKHIADREVRRVLDLACGGGRHTRELSARWWTTGLDLSATLLAAAVTESEAGNYVRGDMRVLPYRDRSFELVVNLFTSFGYFESDVQHLRVLSEVGRVLVPGGMFVLDFFNAAQVERDLVPFDVRMIGDRAVEQRREITDEGRYIRKTIALSGTDRHFEERVRLFTPEDLEAMLGESGFTVKGIAGDYGGAPWTTESPRAIMLAVRE